MKFFEIFTIIISEKATLINKPPHLIKKRHFEMKTSFKTLFFLLLTVLCGCGNNTDRENFIIGIASDVQTFNPAFTVTMTEGNISELFYLGLVGYNWNESTGILEPYPLIAEKWEWNKDSSSVLVAINKKAKWSDGADITSDDVLFSFDVYSDPEVQSKFYGTFENFELLANQAIDLKKGFQIISAKEIRINFKKNAPASTFNFDLPLLPKHIFGKVNRKEMVNSDLNLKPVGSGPYLLEEWKKNQFIRLKLNRESFLAENNSIGEIVFKVIPDYNSEIVQLKKNEIDFAEELKFEQIAELKNNKDLVIATIKGRDYDYLGLNNISPERFEKGVIEDNRFFADSLVRKAIAYAVDREMIVGEYLGGYGKTAVIPIAPIFKSVSDSSLKAFPYSPKIAKEILSRAGWRDTDNDGLLDKNGKKFTFSLALQGSNKLRNEIASIIKDNLKQIGIEVKIETYESSVFVEKMFARKFDAFLSGWSVPIPVDLKPYWNSDLLNNPANTTGYRNKKVDILLEKMKSKLSSGEMKNVYSEFQRYFYNEMPAVLLFWSDKIVSYNKKLSNPDFSPLGTIHYCWKWRLAR